MIRKLILLCSAALLLMACSSDDSDELGIFEVITPVNRVELSYTRHTFHVGEVAWDVFELSAEQVEMLGNFLRGSWLSTGRYVPAHTTPEYWNFSYHFQFSIFNEANVQIAHLRIVNSGVHGIVDVSVGWDDAIENRKGQWFVILEEGWLDELKEVLFLKREEVVEL